MRVPRFRRGTLSYPNFFCSNLIPYSKKKLQFLYNLYGLTVNTAIQLYKLYPL